MSIHESGCFFVECNRLSTFKIYSKKFMKKPFIFLLSSLFLLHFSFLNYAQSSPTPAPGSDCDPINQEIMKKLLCKIRHTVNDRVTTPTKEKYEISVNK